MPLKLTKTSLLVTKKYKTLVLTRTYVTSEEKKELDEQQLSKDLTEKAKERLNTFKKGLSPEQLTQFEQIEQPFAERRKQREEQFKNAPREEQRAKMIEVNSQELELLQKYKSAVERRISNLDKFKKDQARLFVKIILVLVIVMVPLCFFVLMEIQPKQIPINLVGEWMKDDSSSSSPGKLTSIEFLEKGEIKLTERNDNVDDLKKFLRKQGTRTFLRPHVKEKDSFVVNVVPTNKENEVLLQVYHFENLYVQFQENQDQKVLVINGETFKKV